MSMRVSRLSLSRRMFDMLDKYRESKLRLLGLNFGEVIDVFLKHF